jgi:hypothetical protein
MTTTTRSRYIDTKDVAKLIRRDLARAFPGTTFSVRISRYSGGSSIDVRWTDGPTSDAVERVTGRYEGKGLMDNTDYAPYVDGELDGECVHFGSDYVHCTRSFSPAFAQAVADEVADRYGTEWITVKTCKWDGSADWSDAWKVQVDPYTTLQDLIWREISRRDARQAA